VIEARRLDDVEAFLAQAGPLLVEDEPRHNLILGLAGTIRSNPAYYTERRFWLVDEGGEATAAALRTPPHNLVLARPRDATALDALVDAIDEELPGVVAAIPEVDEFARRWAARHGLTVQTIRGQGLHALERVEPVPTPSGSPRWATHSDFSLLTDWWRAFGVEALDGETHDPAGDEGAVEHRLGAGNAGILLWEDAGPVSLAAYGGPTPTGIRIGPVYTPPEHRGRGYATALVAELSARLLAEGRRFCFLYTDLANPTANAIYKRIGYVRVNDSKELAFVSGAG
jgi:predicted GNAT family acetyltransferase